MSIRVVFMGSPEFALPSLRVLSQNYHVLGVVTQPDRASGRGQELKPPPVKSLALELNLPLIQPETLRAPEAMDQLQTWKPDLIAVAAFGQILKQEVLDLPAHGCINVHASLLPRWRGAAPVHAAILAGDEETGVTIMKMDAGLDTGPILSKRALRLTRDDTTGSVTRALSQLGADLLVETLPDYLCGKLIPQAQPSAGISYAPMLKKEDGLLDLSQPAMDLERRVRAMNPWPGTYFEWQGAPLKVHRAHAVGENPSAGQRLVHQNRPAIGTRSGILVLDQVQPAGKKSMSGAAFLAGARGWNI